MKIAKELVVVSSLLVVSGCSSWHEKHARYEQNQQYSSAYGTAGSSAQGSTTTGGTSFQPNSTQSTSPGTFAQTTGQGSESAVISQVQQQLTQDPALSPLVPNIQISFQNGTVTLTGNVPSEQEKQKIESIVKSTSGVVAVNNQLQVSAQSQLNQPGTSENKTAAGGTLDQSTTASSSQSFAPSASSNTNNQSSTSGQTGTEQSSVTPSDQSSSLSSTAQSSTNNESSTAGQTGTEQSSVTPADQSSSLSSTNQSSANSSQELSPTSQSDKSRIYSGNQPSSSSSTNETAGQTGTETLSVNVQGTSESDKTIAQQLTQELRADTSLAALLPGIRINIDNGKATLTGNVKSEDQKKQIESAVQRVSGIANVDDQLQVSTSSNGAGANPSNP